MRGNLEGALGRGSTIAALRGRSVSPTHTRDEGASVQHKILGTTMPVLEIELDAGESIVAESGELSWMTQSIGLTTAAKTAGAKGVFGVLKRAVGGGSIFMTEYTAQD